MRAQESGENKEKYSLEAFKANILFDSIQQH